MPNKAADVLDGHQKVDAQPSEASQLAVNQQTAQSTQLSVDQATVAGSTLAVSEMKGFAQGYASTSQKLAGVLEAELSKIREGRFAAIASGSVPQTEEVSDADFLMDFERDLQSLLAATT